MEATLPLSVFPPRCVNLTTEALTASCEHASFDWLVPNLWTQGWPSGKSSPALSFLSLRKVSPRFPSPTHDKLMYDRGNVMARMVTNTDQKHLLILYAFPVNSVGLIPADGCHAATPDFLGLSGFELTSQAFVPSTSLTLPSPYSQHLRML